MTIKEIINELEIIEGQLDDAFYQLPEYDANQDSRSYLDGGRNDLQVLKDNERQLFEIHRIKTDVLIAEMIAQKK